MSGKEVVERSFEEVIKEAEWRGGVVKEIENIYKDLDDLDNKIDKTKEDLKELQKELSKTEKDLGIRIGKLYRKINKVEKELTEKINELNVKYLLKVGGAGGGGGVLGASALYFFIEYILPKVLGG